MPLVLKYSQLYVESLLLFLQNIEDTSLCYTIVVDYLVCIQ